MPIALLLGFKREAIGMTSSRKAMILKRFVVKFIPILLKADMLIRTTT